mgnify:FL=1
MSRGFLQRFKKHSTLYVFNNVGRIFLVRKVGKRTLRDFLMVIAKGYMLSVFRDYADVTTL